MVPEPVPDRPTLRQAAVALLVIVAVAATAVGLGWVRLANVLSQVLAELLVLGCIAAVAACRYRSPH